jgi:hypothetical protein
MIMTTMMWICFSNIYGPWDEAEVEEEEPKKPIKTDAKDR